MKIRTAISKFIKYVLVFICLVAISTGTFSLNNKENSKLPHSQKATKEQKKQKKEEDSGVARFCSFEAIVPVVHFNIVFYFYFIIRKVEVIILPAAVIQDSTPLFTMSFYKTLFSLIISPNAP